MRNLLIQLSYQRTVDEPGDSLPVPEIWNGIETPCTPESGSQMKARDGSSVCTRPSSSTSTISTEPTLVTRSRNSQAVSATSTCTTGSSLSFPTQFPPSVALNGENVTIANLLYQMRQVACDATCDHPPTEWDSSLVQVIQGSDNQSCALVVPIKGGLIGSFQAMVYRGTAFTADSVNGGNQQQECWDSTEYAINCVSNPDHTGWTNGPAPNQFYQAGIQSLNAQLPGTLTLTTKFATTQGLPRATPPMPSATAGNNDGAGTCQLYKKYTNGSINQYRDDYLYSAYTSYFSGEKDNDGIAAMFKCNSDAEYAVGMMGAQIKTAIGYILSKYTKLRKGDEYGPSPCGSVYLSNGCQVTVNACGSCKHSWPPGQNSLNQQ
jgi:hypothetical protein